MLMSYRVDDGVWQLCGQKILLNLLNKIRLVWTAGGVGPVVNSLDFRSAGTIYLKVPGSSLKLVLQFQQIDKAEILLKSDCSYSFILKVFFLK